ncbi:MAG: flavin-containing monooxygenase [Frankia sp.]
MTDDRPATAGARPVSGPGVLPGHVRVAIVGSGFGGLGVAAGLRAAGIDDFVILERADGIGGTWRDNTYPGCACDVPSHLYSFSFAPNPRWRRAFSGQRDILRYLEDVADRFDLRRHVRFGADMTGSRWDEAAGRWQVRTSRGALTADTLVLATGPLSNPRVPDWPGLDSFTGEVFHSARWRHDLDLTGRRVAVVGTGASAIQFVPFIAPKVARLHLFQRTPAWIMPRMDRSITGAERALFARLPAAQTAARGGIWSLREIGVLGFVVRPSLLTLFSSIAHAQRAIQVRDPALRRILTPDYQMGCKRILLSNDFYPAVSKPNVEVVASGVTRVGPSSVISADGTEREVDTIILGTGFHVTDFPIAALVRGRGGVLLADQWSADGARALRGTTVAGFPNMFLVIGPNTGLSHSSMVQVIESQVSYLVDALRLRDTRGLATIEPTPAAVRAWNADVDRRMAGTVWATGGCRSWYLGPTGRVSVLWPGSTLRFRRATRAIDLTEYATATATAEPGVRAGLEAAPEVSTAPTDRPPVIT